MKTTFIVLLLIFVLNIHSLVIEWGPCPIEELKENTIFTGPWSFTQTKQIKVNLTTECATIKVPAEYDKPEGPKIDLFVKKYKAAANPKRGQLYLVPGKSFF